MMFLQDGFLGGAEFLLGFCQVQLRVSGVAAAAGTTAAVTADMILLPVVDAPNAEGCDQKNNRHYNNICHLLLSFHATCAQATRTEMIR